MGAGLVKAAFRVAAAKDLDHAPTRLFVFMALAPLDSDPGPTYFGGRDALAGALGKAGPAGHRAVTRALEALTAAGIVVSSLAAPGRTARHRLLDEAGLPLRPAANEGRSASLDAVTEDGQRPSNGGRSADKRRTVSRPTEDGERPSKEEAEIEEEGPPPRFCRRHPEGTDTPCGACADARKRAESWRPPRRAPRVHVHRFEPSGYCGGCGERRDDLEAGAA